MKIKLFSFTRKFSNKNVNYNINCNKPIKNIDKLPNNLRLQKEYSTKEVIDKITKHILDKISKLEKSQMELIGLLKTFSRI